MSNVSPFALMCRHYLDQYVKYFPPIFFKEKVIETLSFSIDRLTQKLNVNYSNISEYLAFPYYNKGLLNESGKITLNKMLYLMLSVLSNLYFLAFTMNRYLTKSIIENFLKSTKDYYETENLGKQYIAHLAQIEPELMQEESKFPPNLFLVWMKEPKKFHEKIKFQNSTIRIMKLDSPHS
jgi:hypothetical protein